MKTTKKTQSVFILISFIATLFFLNACTAGPDYDNDLAFLGVPESELDRVLYVKDIADITGNGLSWASAYGKTQLQKAINEANSAYRSSGNPWYVVVQYGTYIPNGKANAISGTTTNRHYHFSMRNGVTIIVGYKGDEVDGIPTDTVATILSGDLGASVRAYHVFYHPDSMSPQLNSLAVLKNITISDGNANASGHFQYGGGMFNENNSPSIAYCTFKNNNAIHGGGISCEENSRPIITNCNFIGNTASNGGGGKFDGKGPTGSYMTMTNCFFSGNKATHDGGGVCFVRIYIELRNCTFIENVAGDRGGGLYNYSNPIRIYNCTFTANKADGRGGGGICNVDNGHTGNVNGSIILSNNASNNPNIYAPQCNFNYNLKNNENINDVFSTINAGKAVLTEQNKTKFAKIKSGGLAHNKIESEKMSTWHGGNIYTVLDQRGQPRLYGTHGDIGAIELQSGE